MNTLLKSGRFATALVLLLGLVASRLGAAEYQVDRTAENEVVFISDAPFEDFEGVTSDIDGYVYWEGDSPLSAVSPAEIRLYFEVLLSTLDTGIGLRNSDMREDYLETDKYPYATYEARVDSIRTESDSVFTVISTGAMTIHGTSNELSLENRITGRDGDFRIESSFPINLNDYNIEVPSLLFLRIADTVQVELDFMVERVKE